MLEYNMELIELIRKIADEQISEHSRLETEKPKEDEFVKTKQLCEELKVCRQTLYNWQKNKNTRDLINPHRKKISGIILWNLQKIKDAIETYSFYFGKDRNYEYKYDGVATNEKRRDDRFMSVRFKVGSGLEVSSEDHLFYMEEMKRQDKLITDRCKFPYM